MDNAGKSRGMRVRGRGAPDGSCPRVFLRAGRCVRPRPEGLSAVKGHGTVLASKKTGQDLDGCGMRSGFFSQERNPVKTSWMRDAIGVFGNADLLHQVAGKHKRHRRAEWDI